MANAIRPRIFTVSAIWDAEAEVWSGSCDALPAAADAETLDGLLETIEAMAVDLLADNHPSLEPAAVRFQMTALRETNAPLAAN